MDESYYKLILKKFLLSLWIGLCTAYHKLHEAMGADTIPFPLPTSLAYTGASPLLSALWNIQDHWHNESLSQPSTSGCT
jgi:hypothetical protein